jgi:2,5-diketo-D-gluconate reductase A
VARADSWSVTCPAATLSCCAPRSQVGFAKAIKESGIPREELYICGSVVSNKASGFDKAFQATAKGCQENMKAFGVGGIDYLDQIMLDYPAKDASSILGQWRAFEEMLDAGMYSVVFLV